jgi:hypothetical protein
VADNGVRATLIGAVALVCAGVSCIYSSVASAATSPTAVKVSIDRSAIVVSPANVPAGKVVLKVFNHTHATRDFRIGARRTPLIRAGRSATLTVSLPRRGPRNVSSVAAARAPRLFGVFDVFAPCTSATQITVRVQLAQDQGGLTVSQSVIPCGTVTFVVTDTGPFGDSLQIFAEAPQIQGTTPELKPGQTATLTLRFPAKGLVVVQSNDYPPPEPEYGGNFNEIARLTLT